MEPKSQADRVPTAGKFLFGGLSGIFSVSITHPLDLVKNRMQMSGEKGATRQYRTSAHAIYYIIKSEGVFAVYGGLTAAFLRQATYTTTRLGLFTLGFEYLSEGGRRPSYLEKIGVAMFAGSAAALIGTPADVAMVRMTLDGRLPPSNRRNYANVFHALYRIIREEGVFTLWRGCAPTVLRAIVANGAQLSTYSQTKRALLDTGRFPDTVPTYFAASLISSIVTAVISMPVDISKTRIQNMRVFNGVPEYKNILDVWVKIVKYEGFHSLWKGFVPYYVRLAPQSVLMFVFLEELSRLYVKYILRSTGRPVVI